MLTINPIKSYTPQLKKLSNNSITSPNFRGEKENKSEYYYQPITLSNTSDITKRPPLRESTLNKLDKIYDDYKQTLNETSLEDIENTITNIENTTNYSRKEILSAMQKATQFGNMKSLQTIGKKLEENNAAPYFERNQNLSLNPVLNYFYELKKIYPIKQQDYNAIILDNNKLEQLEKTKNHNEYKDKNTKFFILSGFNNGITFMNREKNLEETTRYFLENPNTDKETFERAKKLGIEPILITNQNPATTETIYKQLKPEQMSRKQLDALIDANVMERFDNIPKQVEAKEQIATYLDKNLEIYTPERMSKLCKTIHSNIESHLKQQGKSMDDVIYYIPYSHKSYSVVNYMYQQVNNIPPEKFITPNNITPSLQNKTFVVLDDCAVSGSSLIEAGNMIKRGMNKNVDVIYAPMYTSRTVEERKNEFTKNDTLLTLDSKSTDWNDDEYIKIHKLVGYPPFGFRYDCIIFPYMCPDNNSEFAANIGLLHSITPLNSLEPLHTISYSIKSISEEGMNISKLAKKLLKDEEKC